MLGAHLDSWHAATGATDNAIGSSIMMEAARILKAIGVTPRRTIRIALWSGEEQGLLGSKAYVAQHFGTCRSAEGGVRGVQRLQSTSTAAPGRVRGLSVFGPPAAATCSAEAVSPLADLGVVGRDREQGRAGRAAPTAHRSTPRDFPASAARRIPIEYQSYTWHTNLDTYERVIEDDVQKAAIVVATNGVRAGDARRAAPPLRGRRDAEAGGACAARPERTTAPTAPERTYGTYRTQRTYRTPRTLVRYTDLTQPKHRHVTGSVRFPAMPWRPTLSNDASEGRCDVRSRNHACRAVARRPHPLGRGSTG
jgi:hypothetical protein